MYKPYKREEWYEKFSIDNGLPIRFKLDSGSISNVLTFESYVRKFDAVLSRRFRGPYGSRSESHCENFVGIFSTNHDQGNVPTSQNRGNGEKPEHMYFDDKSIRYEKVKIKLT